MYSEGYDGEAASALWRGTQYPNKVWSLGDMEALGHRLELVGRETVAGTDYHVLRLTLSDGCATRWYVHPETWMLELRRDLRALHPYPPDRLFRAPRQRAEPAASSSASRNASP